MGGGTLLLKAYCCGKSISAFDRDSPSMQLASELAHTLTTKGLPVDRVAANRVSR